MNQTDPSTTGPAWHQVSIRFDTAHAAEQTGATDLGPLLMDAETVGLIASWFFIRKSPRWRIRFLPSADVNGQDAAAFVHKRLDTLHETGRIARWVEGIYEPERFAFGGPEAMGISHDLFHQDSRHILNYLGSDHATTPVGGRDQRRELSILLCATLLRGAGQDWYEQGDIWARVSEHRTLPPDIPLDRLRDKQAALRRLMTVDIRSLLRDSGSLAFAADWAKAFDGAGAELGDLAREGTLRRGLRAVLAHHVIFAWNRIGLSYTTQSVLANVAKTVVFGK